jgi:hypothetical protein
MRYFLSPEFHRQLWVRFTPLRLIAAPVILGLCTIVAWNMGMNGYTKPEQAGYGGILFAMQIIYFFVVLIWGTLEAGTAMATEMRSNTWDFQSMSSISPAQLAFGKFFGTTSYTWYFGLLTLAIFGYAYDRYGLSKGTTQDDTLYVMAGYLLAGLLGQSVAFLNYLIDLSSTPGRTTRALLPGGMSAFLLGLVVSAVIFFNILSNAAHMGGSYNRSFRHGIQWYWGVYEYLPFALCSLLFFCCWFFAGSYRLIRKELHYRNQPLVWVLFVFSLIVWDSGFFFSVPISVPTWSSLHHRYIEPAPPLPPDEAFKAMALSRAAFWAFLQAAVITYGSMLNESADLRKYARFAFFAKAGNVRRMLENMPKWGATVPIVFISYFVVAFIKPPGEGMAELAYLTTSMTALLLFMLRDGLVVHAIHNLNGGRGGRFALIFYYIMIYGLLPMTALTMSGVEIRRFFDALGNVGAPTGLAQVTACFYPLVMGTPMFSIFPPLAEVLIAAAGLLFALRRNPATGVIANPKA